MKKTKKTKNKKHIDKKSLEGLNVSKEFPIESCLFDTS